MLLLSRPPLELIAGIVVLCLALGLWLGYSLWGGFKSQLREAEDVIAAFKDEVARLKRRIAEQTTRPSTGFAAVATQAVVSAPPETTPSVAPRKWALETESSASAPASKAFSIWTEAHWAPAIHTASAAFGRGFTLWTEPGFEPSGCGTRPASQAHTVWTLPGWVSTYRPGPPNRSARAYTLWTEEGWTGVKATPPGAGFSVWTEASWIPPLLSAKPQQPSAAWSVWTTADFEAACRGPLPRSRAFSIWTEETWFPSPTQSSPLPLSAAWSLWTSPGFVPLTPAIFMPGQGFSVWTEEGWTASPLRSFALPLGRPFSVWTDDASDDVVNGLTGETAKEVGIPGRLVAALKRALGIGETRAEDSQRSAQALMPAPAAATNLSGSGVFLESAAFTIWTDAHEEQEPVRQNITLTELIDSRTRSLDPPTVRSSPAYCADVPPVPLVVSAQNGAATSLDQTHG